jgi:hypothetical protein
MGYKNTLCEQNTEFSGVKAGGTYTYHCALKVKLHRLYIPLTMNVNIWEKMVDLLIKGTIAANMCID